MAIKLGAAFLIIILKKIKQNTLLYKQYMILFLYLIQDLFYWKRNLL